MGTLARQLSRLRKNFYRILKPEMNGEVGRLVRDLLQRQEILGLGLGEHSKN